jgi:hypothetical protein
MTEGGEWVTQSRCSDPEPVQVMRSNDGGASTAAIYCGGDFASAASDCDGGSSGDGGGDSGCGGGGCGGGDWRSVHAGLSRVDAMQAPHAQVGLAPCWCYRCSNLNVVPPQ